MKLFFQLPYHALGWRAELELAKRFEIACDRLGHEFFSSSSVRDAQDCRADYIFALHFDSAKVSPTCSVGLVWNPVEFMQTAGAHALVKTLTQDFHLYGSESLRGHFSDLSARGYRVEDLGNFYPSAERTSFVAPETFGRPTYVGALWQQDRHSDLFAALDADHAIDGYGPSNGWGSFKNIYRGAFAIDGRSYQSIYRRSGIGLCLHSAAHLREQIPAMRIFEIIASGSVMICDEHPFVHEHFGDTVYYIDTKGSARDAAARLSETVAKIQDHPDRSREMAGAAHQIFTQKFCLERQLSRTLEKLVERTERRFSRRGVKSAKPRVEIVTRTVGARPQMLRRALRSLAGQTFPSVRATILYHGPEPEKFEAKELPRLREEFPELPLELIHLDSNQPLSATVSVALRRSEAGFIGFLDDDDWFFPEHLETMVDTLEARPEALVALSGAAVDWEWALNSSTCVAAPAYARDCSELLSFEPFQRDRFQAGEMNICFAMLLFRRSLLPAEEAIPVELNLGEDRLLLGKAAGPSGAGAVFSSRVSCAWTYRHLQNDNQLDLLSGLNTTVPDFVYKGVNLPFLGSRAEMVRYHTSSLLDKCAAARSKVASCRWLPRTLRPLLYQQELNELLTSILEELVEIGVLRRFNLEAVAQLRARGHLPQPEFNRKVLALLPACKVREETGWPQHLLNVAMAREVDRLARVF